MADKNKINQIKLPNGQQYEIDAKYWDGYETSDIKTINGESIFGAGDITLPSVLKYCGITTTKLEDGSTVNPVIIDGNEHTASTGCVVFYEDVENTKEFVFNGSKWELLGSDLTYKVVQKSVSSPNANGDAVSFIDTISQDANGVITATKKNVDMPIIKGDVENSAVLKGGNNQVISEGSVALGKNNFVGLKGFYYKHIRFVSSTLSNIYLSKTQVIPTITTGGEIKDTTIIPANYLSKGDTISIVNDNKYNEIAVINNMSEGMIQIKWLSEAPFSSIKKETNLSPEDYSIYCLDKPTQGISDLGKYSFANGTDNKAINTYTEVSGKGNVAKGKFSKVWGKDNVGGYNTTTFGTNNVNLADNSLVNGTNNINEGSNSVIHGNKNKNYGKRAFVVGNENITNNENESAFGKYNNSENDTHFSIGIGTSDTNRKNAFEVKQNGDIYIEGVEGKIQDKLNATPDWNAKKGEDGYIDNRTHYAYYFDESIVYDENSPFSTISFDINVSMETICEDIFFGVALIVNISTSLGETNILISKEQFIEMKAGNRVLVTANFPNENVDLYFSYYEYQSDSWADMASITIDGAVYGTYRLVCGLVNQLDEIYIPDTIARKSDIKCDWNAQEGEAGYIENKTHYSRVFEESIVYDENSNSPTISFYINISNAIISKDAFLGLALIVNVSTSLGETSIAITKEQYTEMEAGNRVLITANFPNESVDLYVSYSEYSDITKTEAVISIDGAVYGTYTLGCRLIKQLESSYIPDTILKTTPQTLSDDDKNQALANLGLSDVVHNSQFTEEVSNINKTIEDNEEVVAAALNKLNDELKNISVFEKGDAENSVILQGGDNQVISEGSVALGSNNIAGLKGWYYSSIYKKSNTQIYVYLSKTQKVLPLIDEELKTSLQTPNTSLPNLYELLGNGTEVSLVNDVKYDNAFIITGGENGYVILSTINNSDIPFTTIKHELLNDPEDYSIYCLSQPDKGMFDMGQCSMTAGYNNRATNGKSTAFGFNNHAYGKFSFVEGRDNEAGYAAHAEGRETNAKGEQSHTEGRNTIASGNCSHAEGRNTISSGVNSHSEGSNTTAKGESSHVEGMSTNKANIGKEDTVDSIKEKWATDKFSLAYGIGSHVEGNDNLAIGNYSHVEGTNTIASGWQAHAEGHSSIASGNRSHAEGSNTTAKGNGAHAEGFSTYKSDIEEGDTFDDIIAKWTDHKFSLAYDIGSHVEGQDNLALGPYSHAEGNYTIARGTSSHAEGDRTIASGWKAHAEGDYTTASGKGSHAEGYNTNASKDYSHAEGNSTIASGNHSHAEGSGTQASGWQSHAEGKNTTADSNNSHAEGHQTVANGAASHAEGNYSKTGAIGAHAEGYYTVASGEYSHTSGDHTVAANKAEFACGKYNKSNEFTLFSIGNGTTDSNRSNAFEVTSNKSTKYVYTFPEKITWGHDDNVTAELKGIENEIAKYEVVTTSWETDSDMSQYDVWGMLGGIYYASYKPYHNSIGIDDLYPDSEISRYLYRNSALTDIFNYEGMVFWDIAVVAQKYEIGTFAYVNNERVLVESDLDKIDIDLSDYYTKSQTDSNIKNEIASSALFVASGSQNGVEMKRTDSYPNEATGKYALAIGAKCNANANNSFAGGNISKTDGAASIAFGNHVITSNIGEAAFGVWNKSTKDETLFSVGNGTSDANRKNAFEITTDGLIYIYKKDGTKVCLQDLLNI